MKLWHICEVCDKKLLLDLDEGYNSGWDYPPYMGAFGIISPRTCGDCGIEGTVWFALVLEKKPSSELSEKQQETIKRILGEPYSISE